MAVLCLLGSSATAQVQLESDLVLDLAVTAGGTYDGPLVLRNAGEEASTVRIYQSDYRFNARGETFFEEPGTLPRSNSGWIELPSTIVTIPPGEVVALSYRVHVPADPDIQGSYWSLIFIESVPEEAAPASGATGFSLRQVVRYGVQVMTTVGGGGRTQLAFANPALLQDTPGLLAFAVEVENVGERFTRPDFRLDLYDADGANAVSLESERLRIYPGTSVRPVFDLSGVAPGAYSAILIADAGGENVFGARYTLEIDVP